MRLLIIGGDCRLARAAAAAFASDHQVLLVDTHFSAPPPSNVEMHVGDLRDLARRGRRILLVDATRLRQVGGTDDDWRVHLACDLVAGRMSQVQVTDGHQAEQLGHFTFQAGDLVVADSGYGYRAQVAAAQQQRADVVLRVWLPTFPLEQDTGQAFHAIDWRFGSTARS